MSEEIDLLSTLAMDANTGILEFPETSGTVRYVTIYPWESEGGVDGFIVSISHVRNSKKGPLIDEVCGVNDLNIVQGRVAIGNDERGEIATFEITPESIAIVQHFVLASYPKSWDKGGEGSARALAEQIARDGRLARRRVIGYEELASAHYVE